jgi:hypothetical protein
MYLFSFAGRKIGTKSFPEFFYTDYSSFPLSISPKALQSPTIALPGLSKTDRVRRIYLYKQVTVV